MGNGKSKKRSNHPELKLGDYDQKDYPHGTPEPNGACETILNLDPSKDRRIDSILAKITNITHGYNLPNIKALREHEDGKRKTLNLLEHLRKMVALYQVPELAQDKNVPSLDELETATKKLANDVEKYFREKRIMVPGVKQNTAAEISSTANSNRIPPCDATDSGPNTSDPENSLSSQYGPLGIDLDLYSNEIPSVGLPSPSRHSQDSFPLLFSMDDPIWNGRDIPEIDRNVHLFETHDNQPMGTGSRVLNFRARQLADAPSGSSSLIMFALPVAMLFYFVFKRFRGKSLEQEVIPMHNNESNTA